MKVTILISIVLISLTISCGGESGTETTEDSTASTQPDTAAKDTAQVQEVHHTSPQDAITGAYDLIEEADSAVNQVNARTEELEQMMGDM